MATLFSCCFFSWLCKQCWKKNNGARGAMTKIEQVVYFFIYLFFPHALFVQTNTLGLLTQYFSVKLRKKAQISDQKDNKTWHLKRLSWQKRCNKKLTRLSLCITYLWKIWKNVSNHSFRLRAEFSSTRLTLYCNNAMDFFSLFFK